MINDIIIIGGGLAGCEAALQIAKRGIKVRLYEMKPLKYSGAHSNENLAEIVCSNSFKSNLLTNACGLLKEELRILGSELIKIADEVSVPAGQALAVDREQFASRVTQLIEESPNIEVVHQEVQTIPTEGIVIIATGPLTSEIFSQEILKKIGEKELYFYDAAAPIIAKNSINQNIAFFGNRYEQERELEEDYDAWLTRIESQEKSYLNLPMNQEEYTSFVEALIHAETVVLHDFEKKEIFEGCMPLEVMAKRGIDTLRFGPLKPVGFTDKRTGRRPYAVVQLRQDNQEGTLYNMVGFQTNLKFGEQKRVFSQIPGLENADFVKYGVMHRNTYIHATDLLDNTYQLRKDNRIYFAGQLTGVEGYVESISSGLVAGMNSVNQFLGKEKIIFDPYTMIGSLAKYISTPKDNFQPMNANFGILPELEEKIQDKKKRYQTLAERSLSVLKKGI